MQRLIILSRLMIAAGLCALWVGAAPSAQAQNSAPASTAPAAQIVPPAIKTGTGLASEVLRRIGRSAGLTILTDSTIQQRVPDPTEPTTAENAAQQIAAVLKALPPTTHWIELYVPKPHQFAAWNADDLVAYAYAQEKAFGTYGQPPAGMLDILGQHVTLEKAQPVLSNLNLQKVCLVTNSASNTDVGSWAQMPRTQQKAFVEQSAADILSLPDSQRQPMLDQLKYYDLLKDTMEKQVGHDLGF